MTFERYFTPLQVLSNIETTLALCQLKNTIFDTTLADTEYSLNNERVRMTPNISFLSS